MKGDLTFTLNININSERKSLEMFQEILSKLTGLYTQESRMKATLDDLIQAANDESTVDDSIIALLTSLKASVDAAAGDPVKIQAAFDMLIANKAKVAAAVTANTPAAPPVDVPPPTDTVTGGDGTDMPPAETPTEPATPAAPGTTPLVNPSTGQ